jgi:hypothetical protein
VSRIIIKIGFMPESRVFILILEIRIQDMVRTKISAKEHQFKAVNRATMNIKTKISLALGSSLWRTVSPGKY